MRIAFVAWSQLAAGWHPNGPLLPIEFARISPQGGLIPVLCDKPGVLAVRTLWIESTLDDFDQACNDLAKREGCPVAEIGFVKADVSGQPDERFNALPQGPVRVDVRTRLRNWREANNFDAVMWRDSPADLLQPGQTLQDAKNWVDTHLQGLPGDGPAAMYIRQVPIQVWTDIRAYMAMRLSWVPGPAAPLIRTTIASADDLRFEDWKECRTTVGRMDTILVDPRKVGFSIITGLLTASAFLNFLGVPTSQGVSALSSDVSAAVFIAVMVLVAALFSVDTYYQVMLSGAVERTLDLETQTDPPIRVTKYISINATRSGISYIILALYLVLLATAEGLGLFAARGKNLALALPTGIWLVVGITGLVILVLGVVVIIVAYQRSQPTPPGKSLPWIAGVLLFVTVGLETFLLSHAVTASLDVWHWIAAAGMFLAIYMQLYWVYSAWRSGLYRQKQSRHWPEGNVEKVPTP